MRFTEHKRKQGTDYSGFDRETAEKVLAYHKTWKGYNETPLVCLPGLAKKLGVGAVYIKYEGTRFGLGAFKILGGSYAVGKALAKKYGIPDDQLSFEKLTSSEFSEKNKSLTFVTATDGNHGRGVARTASLLGCRSVVYMPEGSAEERLENIRKAGAEASIENMTYDDCVRLAKRKADENGWIMIQDTDSESRDDVPVNIMQGYLTMAHEAASQLGGTVPTHIFLQAGVGSMAGSVSSYFRDSGCKTVIVEPDSADCLYRTAEKNDGKLYFAGKMNTIMAGLCCGEPCAKAWSLLDGAADYFVTVPDSAAEEAMRMLASPQGNDERVVAGESGAAGLAALYELSLDENFEYRKKTGLDESSVVLLFCTEGATDRANFERITGTEA